MPLETCKCAGQILLVPQEEIFPNRNQPRKTFRSDELVGLAESIRENGIIQPVSVRLRDDDKYELIAGERRLRAARLAGLELIPCILMEVSDETSAVYALLENLQRQNLGFFEEAEAIARLIADFDIGQESVARLLGKAQSTVSNKLRLLRLPSDIRCKIETSGMTERHARALLKLQTVEQLDRAVDIVSQRRLNVAETERLTEQILRSGAPERKQPLKIFKDLRIFVNTLNHAVDTMRRAGIAADAAKRETASYIEYTVRIPKE